MTDVAFRRALSEFATGVAVVTARGPDGDPVGLTMSSFNSVSIDPPLVLFSVDRRANSLPAMLDAQGYAINVLARDQEVIAEQFARALGDKWQSVGTTLGHFEVPLIEGALAHLECAPHAHHDGGDHVIFVARVLRHTVHPDGREPLVFFRGGYVGLAT